MEKTAIELYFHIPFCVRKCRYCDFYSGAFSDGEIEAYFETVLEEMRSCPYSGEAIEVSSIFFGGGTPSSVDPRFLGALLCEARRGFKVLPDCEITIECNPGTVTEESLLQYRAYGVNRLSFGLQSADDRLLRKIGRIHTFAEFLSGYDLARKAGFQNISVDLMAGLPLDTPENFEKTLKTVVSLEPEHCSVYSLIIEENTGFYALYGPEGSMKSELPSEEEEREMIHRAAAILGEHGYRQYEISNFALPGKECRHNIGYWTHVPYLGFGASAASFIGGKRFRNAPSLRYLDLPYDETETLETRDLMSEFMILGFRMNDGVSESDFERRFGQSFREVYPREIEMLLREELIESYAGKDRKEALRLTERGRDLANLVFEEFL